MDDSNRPTAASPGERLNGRGTAMGQPDIERIVSRLGPRAVYGDPVERGAMTVIPVAEVRFGFGFGSGQSEEARRAAGPEHHQGQGGGGGARVVPRGFIEISADGVRFRPLVDVNRLIVAGLAVWGVVALVSVRWGLGRRR